MSNYGTLVIQVVIWKLTPDAIEKWADRWARPGDIDLANVTKAHRKAGDPGELGTFYFRY